MGKLWQPASDWAIEPPAFDDPPFDMRHLLRRVEELERVLAELRTMQHDGGAELNYRAFTGQEEQA